MKSKIYTADIPKMKFRRNLLGMPHSLYTSMTVGKLYPLGEPIEVVPGDTISDKVSGVIRVSSSFTAPVFDNLGMQVHAFFVPLRILDDTFEKIFTNDDVTNTTWSNPSYASAPVTQSAVTISEGTVGDYLGLPTYGGTSSQKIPKGLNVYPFRAFATIYNEWFRNTSHTKKVIVNHTATVNSAETPNSADWTYNNYAGGLPSVAKVKDIFTSAILTPQKGPASGITIPASNVFASGLSESDYTSITTYWRDGSVIPWKYGQLMTDSGSDVSAITTQAYTIPFEQIRVAGQLQLLREKEALGGRFREWLYLMYGVTNGDARMQVPEYLGGCMIPIQLQQVTQTATGGAGLGSVAAYSLSGMTNALHYTKSFTEPGYIMYVGSIKILGGHTYCQGVSPLWSRKDRTDWYNPIFSHLGAQPIYKSQLFADSVTQLSLKDSSKIFGYNEPWYEMRYIPNRVTGGLRPTANTGYEKYTFADLYLNAPSLIDSFIYESADEVERSLAVDSQTIDNFLVNLYFDTKVYRCIPIHGVSGKVDHII